MAHEPRIGRPVGRRGLTQRMAAAGVAMTVAATLLAASTAIAQSPATDAATGSPVTGGTLVFARQAEPASLLPNGAKGAADNASIWVLPAIFDQLVEVRDADTPQPGLAESWEVAPDGMSATFTLRDAKFSNGEPVTAEDVVFSIKRFIDPEVNAFYGGVAGSFKDASVVDDRTVRIDMKRVDGAFLDALAMFVPSIIPQAYFESLGATEDERQTKFAEAPIGSGPFMLKSWKRGESLELVRNPYYWQEGKPYLDGVTFLYLPDDNTRLLKLTSGEAHIAADVPYNQIAAVDGTEGLSVMLEEIAGWKGLWFNNALAPFSDPNVRLALNYATPKEAILRSVLYDAADVQNSVIARVKYTDPSVAAYPYDIEKARAAMAASTVPNGFDTSIVIVAGDAVEKQIAEILQAEWSQIGINVTVDPVDVATIWERYGGMAEPNVFTFPGSFLSSDTLSEDNLAFVFLVPESGANSFFTNYTNDQVIDLVGQLSGSLDEETRAATFKQIQELSMADAPNVPMYFTKARTGVSDKVQGFRTQKTGWWKLEDVWLQP